MIKATNQVGRSDPYETGTFIRREKGSNLRSGFLTLYVISRIINQLALGLTGRDLYLLGWTTHNLYWYFWVAPILLAGFNKNIWAWAITGGNLLGVVLGQTLGEYLESLQPESYTRLPMGFQVWIVNVLLGFVLGFVAEMVWAFVN